MADVVALLAERREEIRAMGKLLNEMASTIGEDAAEHVLCEAIAAEARASGRKYAPSDPSEAGPLHFASTLKNRGDDGGMDEITATTAGNRLTVGVGRCDICPLYQSSNLPKSIAHALSCGREAPFAEGYDHRMKLVSVEAPPERERSCRMVFTWDENAKASVQTPKTSLSVNN